MDRDDIRVLQSGNGLDLALEPLDTDPLRQFGQQDLHHDLPLEPQLLGDEHARHPAAAKFTFQGVATAEGGLQLVAQLRRRQRHLHRVENPYIIPARPVRPPFAPSSVTSGTRTTANGKRQSGARLAGASMPSVCRLVTWRRGDSNSRLA